MTTNLWLGLTFRAETCCVDTCRVAFALEAEYQSARRNDHGNFYCPNGHPQRYTAESDKARLEREKAELERRVTCKQAQIDGLYVEQRSLGLSLRATRGVVTRTKRRISHGVCPCCKRTFKQLGAHMKDKHPSYAQEPAREA